jgi:hypothetical protein
MKFKKYLIKSTNSNIPKRLFFNFFHESNFTIVGLVQSGNSLKVELFGDKASFKTLISKFNSTFGFSD